MPKYDYLCHNCKAEFEIRHSIKEKLEKCGLCGEENSLEKLLSTPMVFSSSSKEAGKERKTGALVEEYIELNRKQLKNEKERLKKEKY